MDPEKKLGIILILVGLLIPLAALPFVSGFSREKGFYENLYNVGIAIGNESKDRTFKPAQPSIKGDRTNAKLKVTWSMLMPQKIPLRFLLVPAVILVYMGIIKIDRSRRRQKSS
ncbi:MAG: hypothetical protein AB7Y74_14125 [Syntrophorhabdus sp.]